MYDLGWTWTLWADYASACFTFQARTWGVARANTGHKESLYKCRDSLFNLWGFLARVVVGVPARVFVRISLFSLGQLMEKTLRQSVLH